MSLHVFVPVVSPEEHFLTKGTFEGAVILPRVGFVVAVEVLFACEGFAAF